MKPRPPRKRKTRAESDQALYLKYIEEFGVDDPRAVWNFHGSREEAIEDLASRVGRAGVSPSESVLELGCGNLLVFDALSSTTAMDPARYCGVDDFAPFLAFAATRGVRVVPVIPNETFDVSFIVGFFASLSDDQEVHQWIDQVRRVTTKRLLLSYTTRKLKGIFVPNLDLIMRLFYDCQPVLVEVRGLYVTMVVDL